MSSLYQNTPTSLEQDARLALLTEWLGTLDLVEAGSRRPASSDASFRRYFRLDVVPALRDQVTMLGSFVEVTLAKEGHDGMVGINLLTKIQLPTLPAFYGAMLAGFTGLLMSPELPREIRGSLDAMRTAITGGASETLVLELAARNGGQSPDRGAARAASQAACLRVRSPSPAPPAFARGASAQRRTSAAPTGPTSTRIASSALSGCTGGGWPGTARM